MARMPKHNLAVMDAVNNARNEPENKKWFPKGSLRDEKFMDWYHEEVEKVKDWKDEEVRNGIRKEVRMCGIEEDPFDEIVFLKGQIKHREDGPAVISPNGIEYWREGQLHHDGGPSINYFDGMCLYHLHGVACPRKIVEAKQSDFKPSFFTKEENVEVRREVLRKFGTETVISKIGGKKIDEKDGYELYQVELAPGHVRNCLKMENATLKGIYHMEWVGTAKTVDEAITHRNQSEFRPEQIT